MRSIIDDSYNQWLAEPSKANMGVVVQNLSPILQSTALRTKGPTSLLKTKAKALTIKAIKSFDPTRGSKLSTHVTNQLQPLIRYGRVIGKPVHTSESAYLAYAELRRHTSELRDELLAEPTDEQIADRMQVSVKKLNTVRASNPATAYDASIEGMSDENSVTSSVVDDGTSSTLNYATDVVYNSIDARDKTIMEHKTGYKGADMLDNASIAKKLNVSPAFISQRSKVISDHIGEVFNAGA